MITLTALRLWWRGSTRARPYRARSCLTMLRSLPGARRLFAATHAAAAQGLSELQGILGEARLTETSVAWLTSGAVATGPEDGVAGLSRAPLWGLVRSARAEHPDRRLQLVDVDAAAVDVALDAALLARLLSTTTEPELALRHGAVMTPRLVRAGAGTSALRAPTGTQDYRVAVTVRAGSTA